MSNYNEKKERELRKMNCVLRDLSPIMIKKIRKRIQRMQKKALKRFE